MFCIMIFWVFNPLVCPICCPANSTIFIVKINPPKAAADGDGEVEDAQHQRPLTFTVPNNKDCAHQQKDRRTNQKDDIPLRVNQVKMAALALLPVL